MDNRQLLWESISAVTLKTDFPFEDSTKVMEEIGLDSTSAMELLMELEDRSPLEIDPDNLSIDDFQTVGAFVRFLDRELPVVVIETDSQSRALASTHNHDAENSHLLLEVNK
ncbi:acyl carrier protein [Mycobacteroides abscessus]|uniref:acyl carrier protein n=1 Tax=Mycobacteroides abscessus TaxID=36809 RepID=UPI000C25CA88|nr:phosphopantetheine-binding protein [Mycobacteroides abscessus]PVA97615.1 acyl carrier protein [Mycobacteroides abscessus]QOF34631.1 hypothetical protein E3G57_003547 [Mycobacteroides abscessus]